ncbi:rod shape-determining protein MreC [Geovibrio thiophilus]|uniref:Cell shape-determining protein MreC n=1 Tax=Geovibrio thiophilus TaxID=139438 RepID=A0A3R5YZA6_9BACT|nr:rod shape-determining protein MreC [Geovibrio thiophilus]QAR33166.1 rod shape-determining protein MreC [Geovibrio thiophilus]
MTGWKKIAGITAFLFFLILLQVQNPEINGPFKGIFGNVVNPFIYYSSKTSAFFRDVWSGYINLVYVRQDNLELKDKNDRLKMENSLLREKVLEYERLKKLLNFKEAYSFQSVACNVVGRNVDGYLKYIIIDRGSEDGIEIKDPVISFEGLVGSVSEVYKNTARVDVILNIKNNASVMNKRTRAVGIIRGNGEGQLVVDYYDRLDKVQIKDELITSGLGGVYPKGIAVGVVDRIDEKDTGLFQDLFVRPVVDFYKLENVLVLKR